jgi:pimeloyl-ACP methyl ester carboxylesterase
MQEQCITLGLYVSTVMNFFTSVLHSSPSLISESKPSITVMAQGFSTAVIMLAIKESPIVAMSVANVIITNGYAPPHTDALPMRHMLLRACAAFGADMARTIHLISPKSFNTTVLLPLSSIVSITQKFRVQKGYDTPFSGTTCNQSTIESYAHFPLAQLKTPFLFPMPIIGELPLERFLSFLAPSWTWFPSNYSGASFTSATCFEETFGTLKQNPNEGILEKSNWTMESIFRDLFRYCDRELALELESAKVTFRDWALGVSTGAPHEHSKVLTIWGAQDVFWPKEVGEWWADLTDGELIVLPNAGHYISDDDPLRLVDAVHFFIQSSSQISKNTSSLEPLSLFHQPQPFQGLSQ